MLMIRSSHFLYKRDSPTLSELVNEPEMFQPCVILAGDVVDKLYLALPIDHRLGITSSWFFVISCSGAMVVPAPTPNVSGVAEKTR